MLVQAGSAGLSCRRSRNEVVEAVIVVRVHAVNTDADGLISMTGCVWSGYQKVKPRRINQRALMG